jgi:hypothetical protein
LSNSPRRMPSSSAASNISQLRNLACDEKTSGNDRRLPEPRLGPIAREWLGYRLLPAAQSGLMGVRQPGGIVIAARVGCAPPSTGPVTERFGRPVLTVQGPLQEVFDNREVLIERPRINARDRRAGSEGCSPVIRSPDSGAPARDSDGCLDRIPRFPAPGGTPTPRPAGYRRVSRNWTR